MPYYDYRCDKCQHTFEEFLPMKSRKKPEKKNCPACGEAKSVKQFITGVGGIGIDANHRIDGDAKGAFKDIMAKVSQSAGIKGSKREAWYNTRYGLS